MRALRPCLIMASSAKVVTSGCFQCRVASFRVAGVALRDIQTCFVTRRNSFSVAGTILLRRFQKMHCLFCGRRSTLATSIVISRGGAALQTCRVASCCVLLRIVLSDCVKW